MLIAPEARRLDEPPASRTLPPEPLLVDPAKNVAEPPVVDVEIELFAKRDRFIPTAEPDWKRSEPPISCSVLVVAIDITPARDNALDPVERTTSPETPFVENVDALPTTTLPAIDEVPVTAAVTRDSAPEAPNELEPD